MTKTNILLLVAGIAAGLFLYLSWVHIPVIGELWDIADSATFFTLNGSLGLDNNWAMLWAVLNNRLFDSFAALLFGLVFYFYIRSGESEDMNRRFSLALVAIVFSLVTAQLGHLLLSHSRESPSRVLKPAYLLSQLFPEIKPKDSSGTSFPGDHGTLSLMFSIFIAYLGGLRFALIGAVVALFTILPRLFSGAHWLTDIAIGSLTAAIVASAILLNTPLLRMCAGYIEKRLKNCSKLTKLLRSVFFIR